MELWTRRKRPYHWTSFDDQWQVGLECCLVQVMEKLVLSLLLKRRHVGSSNLMAFHNTVESHNMLSIKNDPLFKIHFKIFEPFEKFIPGQFMTRRKRPYHWTSFDDQWQVGLECCLVQVMEKLVLSLLLKRRHVGSSNLMAFHNTVESHNMLSIKNDPLFKIHFKIFEPFEKFIPGQFMSLNLQFHNAINGIFFNNPLSGRGLKPREKSVSLFIPLTYWPLIL